MEDLPSDSESNTFISITCFGWTANFGGGFVTVVAGICWGVGFGGGFVTVVVGIGCYCMVLLPPFLFYD